MSKIRFVICHMLGDPGIICKKIEIGGISLILKICWKYKKLKKGWKKDNDLKNFTGSKLKVEIFDLASVSITLAGGSSSSNLSSARSTGLLILSGLLSSSESTIKKLHLQ